MQDKDLRSMTRILFPLCRAVILTRVPYKRSATPEDLLAASPPFAGRILLEPDTRRAVQLALLESKKGMAKKRGTCTLGTCPRSQRGPTPVVIAGSVFLIGEVKRLRLFEPTA